MSWPEHFIDALGDTFGSGRSPGWVWKVRTVDTTSGPSGLRDPTESGADYVMVSAGEDAKFRADPILVGPPSFQGSRLTPGSWASTIGTCTFDLAGDLSRFKKNVTRGSLLKVLCGRQGWADEDFAPVHVGRVVGCRMARGRVALTIGDALTMLDCRALDDPDIVQLFYTLSENNRTSTTLTANYTAGDATINVASTGSFTCESGGTGALRIGNGIVYYTGKTGTSFTGCSSSGEVGTTLANAASGSSVYECALLRGHPIAIAQKVMQTTNDGGADNGTYDVYPAPWGLRVAQDFVDNDDCDAEKNVAVVAAGSYIAEIVVEEPVVDPRSWLSTMLSTFGMCFTQRHGLITIRAPSLLEGRQREAIDFLLDDSIVITDEIASEWWDTTAAAEVASVVVYGDSASYTSSAASIGTLPAEAAAEYDATSYLFDNVLEVGKEISQRVARFHQAIGEVLTIPCAGLTAWRLAPADRVIFRSRVQGTRYDYSDSRVLFVLSVTPDPARGRVVVRASYTPDDASGYPWGNG